MAISLFFISINTSLALEFQLTSPESVNAKESFTVSIEASTSEKYDVKITVQDSNKKIISEIYNDGWKNPYYYLKSIFSDQKEFKIRVTGNPGKYDICARLRKTGKTSFTEQCKEINVNQAVNPDSDIEEKSEKKSSKKLEEDSDEDDDENDEKDNEDEEDEDQKENNVKSINNSQTTNKQ